MPPLHLDDTQQWFVANFRRDPQVANLRLRDGNCPDPPLSREQVQAWDTHAKSCRLCESMVECHHFSIRRAENRRKKLAAVPPPPREPSWEDMVE
ncbi:MAG: hypothetical protein G01um101431_602 [Parcubacteria group bacterium Gr01-1014_31]|nr:MAG: hypothetical protein G01um101431_602 [Parcubacteria group bacterium Gr01-1014_31]